MPFIEDHVEEYFLLLVEGGIAASVDVWQLFSAWRNIRLVLIWQSARGRGGNLIAALLEERRQPLSAHADGRF